jgi:hypothetical protein
MSEVKYKVSIINSKWEPIKRNIEMFHLPRKDEYVHLNDQYYTVLNIVHMLNENHEVFIVIEELDNQEIKIINEKS